MTLSLRRGERHRDRARLPAHGASPTTPQIDLVALDLPPTSFSTQALWFELDAGALAEEIPLEALLGALHATEHAQIAVLPLIAMCDRWDIGGLSTNFHPQTGAPTIFIYDGHPGGIGITRTAFARFEELCERRAPADRRVPAARAAAPRACSRRSAATSTSRCPRPGAGCCWSACSARGPSATPRRWRPALNVGPALLRHRGAAASAASLVTASGRPAMRSGIAHAGVRCARRRGRLGRAPRRRAGDDRPPPKRRPRQGPGGRTRLTRWTLALDPADRGLALGWQRGAFTGAAVSVPNVVDAQPSSAGRRAKRNYEGSVAWYRTTLPAPARPESTRSTSPRRTSSASVWIDGHALGSAQRLLSAVRSARPTRRRHAHARRARRLARPRRAVAARASTARGSTGAG